MAGVQIDIKKLCDAMQAEYSRHELKPPANLRQRMKQIIGLMTDISRQRLVMSMFNILQLDILDLLHRRIDEDSITPDECESLAKHYEELAKINGIFKEYSMTPKSRYVN
jgi:hypothetical protein